MSSEDNQDVFTRLLALDLDGTVMDDQLCIRPSVHNAVQHAREAGVLVTVATGRGYDATLPFAAKLDITAPLICYQGGQIRCPVSGDILHEVTFDRSLAIELAEWAAERQRRPFHGGSDLPDPLASREGFSFERGSINVALFVDGVMHLERMDQDPEFFERYFGQRVRLVPDLRVSLSRQPHKCMLIAHPATCDEILPELKAAFAGRLQIVRSHPLFVEAAPEGVSKGRGLALLAAHVGVAQEDTIAVGDNENDLSMVLWAGVGVAMGNATPQLKQAADWIAPSVHEDGVAAVVKRFILDGRCSSDPLRR